MPKRKIDEQKPIYKFWLIKSEPESRIEKGVDVKFGIEDLKKEENQTACWDGVRNYQARHFHKPFGKKWAKNTLKLCSNGLEMSL